MEMKNKLTFLGRGSAYHLMEKDTAAYYCKNKKMILLDCGETVFKTVIRTHLLEEVEDLYIVITHMHSDHVGSLAGLVGFYNWKFQRKAKVFFPEKDNMVTFLQLQGMVEGQVYDLVKEDTLRIPDLGLEIIPHVTRHATNISCFSYLFHFEQGNEIFYSGDSKIVFDGVVPFLTKGGILYQDVCLSEDEGCPHMSAKSLACIIPEKLRNQVYCIHISGDQYEKTVSDLGFQMVSCVEDDIYFSKPNEDDREQLTKVVADWRKFGGRMNPGLLRYLQNDYREWLQLIRERDQGINLGEEVPQTLYLLKNVEGTILGAAAIRHYLNHTNMIDGGHIAYGICPAYRGKGYGTKILQMTLEKCYEMNLDRVLVVCDSDNLGSKAVIENNKGVLENETVAEDGALISKYWIQVYE